MEFFDDKHIKNITLLGSSGAGKTTLAESMLFQAGIINRMGSVENQNTVSDYHAVEHDREGSVHMTAIHTEWRNYKINVLDTPGLDEFSGEIIPAVRVADTAVFVINAQNGIEIATQQYFDYVDQFKKPTLFVINQLDHPKADFEGSLESLREEFGNAVTLIQYPVNPGNSFNGIIDLLKMKMYVFKEGGGKPDKLPIPDNEMEKALALHNELVEKAAENDESLMEQYFEKGTLNEDEMSEGLRIGMMKHDVFPVFLTSAKMNMGAGRLMGFIDNVAPSAHDALPEHNSEGEEIPHKTNGPVEIFVFKIQNEPNLGTLTLFKVISGELTAGMELSNHTTDQTERLSNLYVVDGHSRNQVERMTTGDIGATLKLKNTHVNDTLSAKQVKEDIEPMVFPEPRMKMAISSDNEADAEKISEALHKLMEEDPTLTLEYSNELKQQLIGVQGELHLSVIKWYLEHIYGLSLSFAVPKISYRETIEGNAEALYRHKKQSGGSGQFAEVKINIAPYVEGAPDPDGYHIRERMLIDLEWGGKLEFYNCIVGGSIDARFIPSVIKGIMEKMENGPLTGSPIRDVRVVLFDGKMHAVDSNDMAFKLAGLNAFKKAFMDAKPSLMEPVYELAVKVPESMVGEVITDLQSRRSQIKNIDSEGKNQVVVAKTPLAELNRYNTTLQSITQGRATFTQRFEAFEKVNQDIFNKLVKDKEMADA